MSTDKNDQARKGRQPDEKRRLDEALVPRYTQTSPTRMTSSRHGPCAPRIKVCAISAERETQTGRFHHTLFPATGN